MYTANILAFFEGIDAAKWIGLAVAVLGVALLFSDLVMNIKKRNHTKMNIVAMVFLCLSLVCYVVTQWVIPNLPSLFGFIWVVFLVAYFICDIIMAVGIGRDNHRKKRGLTDPEEDDAPNGDSEEIVAAENADGILTDEQTDEADKKPSRKKGKNKKSEKVTEKRDVEVVNMLEEQDSDGTTDPTE